MKRERVDSSNIKSVGYDEKNKVMEVEFHSGGVYRYDRVPKSTHRGLLEADSIGSYFHTNVRENFKYRKV